MLSVGALQVIPAIRVDANAVYRVAAAGQSRHGHWHRPDGSLRRSGSATATATITAKSATQTRVHRAVRARVRCDHARVRVASRRSRVAASWSAAAAWRRWPASSSRRCCRRVRADARLRLVPGKETWVRACTSSSSQSKVPAPLVRLTGYNGAAILGTVDMAGPTMLPVVRGAIVPDAVRYNEAQSFNVELPATWVRSWTFGARRGRSDASAGCTDRGRRDSGGGPGLHAWRLCWCPSSRAVSCRRCRPPRQCVDEITRRFPIPASNITVTVRQPYTLTSVADGLDTSTEWQNALSELNQLRAMEAGSNTRFYFGSCVAQAAGSPGSATYRAERHSAGIRTPDGSARCRMNWDIT